MANLFSLLMENKGLSASIGALVLIFLLIVILKWLQEANKKLSNI